MKFNKKGQAGVALKATALLTLVIGLVISFSVIAQTADDVANAAVDISEVNETQVVVNGTTVSSTKLPFSGFFSSGGVVMLGFMAAVALGVFGALGLQKR